MTTLSILFAPIINRERARLKKHLVRAKQRDLDATLTLAEWLTNCAKHSYRCAFCGGPFETMEHLTRLADGGGTTRYNCVPCCKECNARHNRVDVKRGKVREELSEL